MSTKMSQTAEHLTKLLQQLNSTKRLEAYNQLSEDIHAIDQGIAMAIMSGRPDLIKLAKPRELTAQECSMLYNLVRILLETNALLQQHAQQVAELVTLWTGHFKGLQKAAMEIGEFANFKECYASDNSE